MKPELIKVHNLQFRYIYITYSENQKTTMVSEYINTMKTTSIVILTYTKLLNSMDTYKHRSQEKLSIKKSFSLITSNLFRKKLVLIKT